MTIARKQLIDLQSTPYYHVMNRCVRRAFLCGIDRYGGQRYQHRRQWIVDKVKALSGIFAIDVCAYAIMSNHYHLVLHVNKAESTRWTGREVLSRWCQVFSGPTIVQAYLNDEILSPAQLDVVNSTTLSAISDSIKTTVSSQISRNPLIEVVLIFDSQDIS